MLLERLRTILCTRHRFSPTQIKQCTIARRAITSSPATWSNRSLPPRPKAIPDEEFTEVFLKGSGPGGQKINKTSSAVQLKHLPSGLVLKVQATRSRTQNRKIARQMLAERVEEMEMGGESRVAKVREVKSKRKASSAKKSRRKYRALEEAKRVGGVEEGEEGEGEEGMEVEVEEEGEKSRDLGQDKLGDEGGKPAA